MSEPKSVNRVVCVDAGLVIKFISPESDSAQVEALFARWKQDNVAMIAPAFAPAEMDSVLRQKVVRKELTSEVADAAFQLVCQLPITIDAETDCRTRAWELAKQFELPTVYDAVYLALAEAHQCDFWTADRKLFARVKDQLVYVKHLSNSK
ncbi:MAG: type II toxin-antitoxin system VapC family toxin [Chloroflexi bacterium]|nr:type II toxin-antitoxin system VapC family toxin [Chloroflexota bacterium]